MATTTVYKTSVSIKKCNWQKIKNEKNKSSIINKALDLFFDYKDHLLKSDNNYWKSLVQDWLEDIKKWDIITINPKNEKISRKMIKDKLWF